MTQLGNSNNWGLPSIKSTRLRSSNSETASLECIRVLSLWLGLRIHFLDWEGGRRGIPTTFDVTSRAWIYPKGDFLPVAGPSPSSLSKKPGVLVVWTFDFLDWLIAFQQGKTSHLSLSLSLSRSIRSLGFHKAPFTLGRKALDCLSVCPTPPSFKTSVSTVNASS